MPVAVAQPQKDSSDNQALLSALGIAKDLFKVGMDERQAKRADELNQNKISAQSQANALEMDRQNRLDTQNAQDREINHLRDWRPAKEQEPGAVQLPGKQGFFLPRSEDARREKMAFDRDQKDKPEKLTSSAALEVGDIFGTNAAIENLSKKWDEKVSQSGSGIASFIPTTKAQSFDYDRNTAVQDIGKALEGGKMTDQDRLFYLNMMPKATDTAQQKIEKIAALKQVAKNKIQAKVKALGSANFNVGGFTDQLKIFDQPQTADEAKPGFGEAAAATAPSVQEVHRFDPKSGKTAVFNAVTKEFIRYAN